MNRWQSVSVGGRAEASLEVERVAMLRPLGIDVLNVSAHLRKLQEAISGIG